MNDIADNQKNRHSQLYTALTNISEDYWQVLFLLYFEELSESESLNINFARNFSCKEQTSGFDHKPSERYPVDSEHDADLAAYPVK